MSEPEQEWTVEDTDYGPAINRHDGSEPICFPVGLPWLTFAKGIISAHNAALADERGNVSMEASRELIMERDELREQLAAEREKRERAEQGQVCDAESLMDENQQLREQLAAEREKRKREMADYETLCADLQKQLDAEREELSAERHEKERGWNNYKESQRQLDAEQKQVRILTAALGQVHDKLATLSKAKEGKS